MVFVGRMISGVRDRRRPEYGERKSGVHQVERRRYALDMEVYSSVKIALRKA
jgi:hypothetical protein